MKNYENEIWKPIKGYEGLYEVSSCGRVRSLKRKAPHIMGQGNNGYGYLYAPLTKDGKTTNIRISRLVAEAFIPNPNNLPIVDHINHKRAENYVENLRWVSYSENAFSSWGEDVKNKVICVETNKIFNNALEASKWIVAQDLSVSAPSEVAKRIRALCRGNGGKTAYGYHWEFYYEESDNND